MAQIVEQELEEKKTWGISDIPQFTGMKALVLPGAFYGSCVALMAQAGFSKAESVEDADIVVFIGGVDVDPQLYGQSKIDMTQTPSPSRDKMEIDVYAKCIELGKPMFGICRGAQFLHVMNGGELWQHVEGHNRGDHVIYDTVDEVYITATSYHHQMLALHARLDVIAVCPDQISRKFHSDTMVINLDKEGNNAEQELEIEAGCYYETKCFFVQGHPEVGSEEYKSWCMTKLMEFIEDVDDEIPGDVDMSIDDKVELWREAALM